MRDQKRYTSDEKLSKGINLDHVTTLNRDKMSRQCAVEMGDTKIMIYDGDIISRDDIYYHKCMTGFTNSHRSS